MQVVATADQLSLFADFDNVKDGFINIYNDSGNHYKWCHINKLGEPVGIIED